MVFIVNKKVAQQSFSAVQRWTWQTEMDGQIMDILDQDHRNIPWFYKILLISTVLAKVVHEFYRQMRQFENFLSLYICLKSCAIFLVLWGKLWFRFIRSTELNYNCWSPVCSEAVGMDWMVKYKAFVNKTWQALSG